MAYRLGTLASLFFFAWCGAHTHEFSLVDSTGAHHVFSAATIEQLTNDHAHLNMQHYFLGEEPNFVERDAAQEVTLLTADGFTLTGYYWDRGSDTMVVVGPGAQRCSHDMPQFVHLTEGYDLFMCNYRWYPLKNYFSGHLDRLKDIHSSLIFDVVHNDVPAVINWVHAHKKYRQVIGLGQSGSSWLFTMTQAQLQNSQRCFDKIILDSSPTSLWSLAQCLADDPSRAWTGGVGGAAPKLQWFSTIPMVNRWVAHSIRTLFYNIEIRDYLARLINVPLLFIQGTTDPVVPNDHFFESLRKLDHPEYAVFLTPYGHLFHDVCAKELYRAVIKEFIDQPTLDAMFTRLGVLETAAKQHVSKGSNIGHVAVVA